jgi:hypothetical protein
MQLFRLKELLVGYPKLSNIPELIQADILLMPAEGGRFINDQFLLDESISEKYKVNFRFFSESQTSLHCILKESAIPIEHIFYLGKIVTTLVGFYKLYEILTEITKGKKFRLENYVKIDEDCYVSLKFEGTIDEYKTVYKNFKSSVGTLIESKENK